MAGNGALFDIEHMDGAHVVRFSHLAVAGPDAITKVRRELADLIRPGERIKIVLDLEKAKSLSSEAISMIVALGNVISPRGGQLHLANLSRETYAAFDILMLRDIARIFGTVRDAIDCFE
jgi:anti-anti-sigma factor